MRPFQLDFKSLSGCAGRHPGLIIPLPAGLRSVDGAGLPAGQGRLISQEPGRETDYNISNSLCHDPGSAHYGSLSCVDLR